MGAPTQPHLLLPVLQALLTPAGHLSHHHSNPNHASQAPGKGPTGQCCPGQMGGHRGPRGGAASRTCLFQGAPTCPIKCRLPPQPTPMPGSPPPPPPPTAQGDCTPTPNRDPQLSHHLSPLPGLPLRHSDPSHPAWTPSEGGLPPPRGPISSPTPSRGGGHCPALAPSSSVALQLHMPQAGPRPPHSRRLSQLPLAYQLSLPEHPTGCDLPGSCTVWELSQRLPGAPWHCRDCGAPAMSELRPGWHAPSQPLPSPRPTPTFPGPSPCSGGLPGPADPALWDYRETQPALAST